MDPWTTKRILILGMTYPSYSMKYVENACTGGVDEDGKMVRIHPVPKRYMDNPFKKFQWIRAPVMKHQSDPRPESLRIDPLNIEPMEVIPSSKPEERRQWVEKSPHLVRSVEELKDRWEKDRTSLGAIRPKQITGVRVTPRPPSEREEWEKKERELLAQKNMYDEVKPIDFPEVYFRVSWLCDDPRCEGHEMGLMTWDLHELYRKFKHQPDVKTMVEGEMRKRLDLEKRDVFFFLGNFRTTQWNFGLMDAFSPGKRIQMDLFAPK